MYLNNLSDNAGATKARKRVGRGIGSGLGKTAGRGHKGQKSRSGVAIKGFEGGQMPIYRRLPKHGFTNIFRVEYQALNLGRLQTLIDSKKLDPSETITPELLVKAGAVKRLKDGIKLLGVGELTSKIDLEIHAISASAEQAVVKAGGQVRVLVAKKKEPAEA